jgi:hypothetical protein
MRRSVSKGVHIVILFKCDFRVQMYGKQTARNNTPSMSLAASLHIS